MASSTAGARPLPVQRGAPQGGAAAGARRDVTEYGMRRVLIVLGVMAASLMQTLDGTIANVALPTIQGNLGASIDEGTWVITAYTIAAIIVIPLTPWLQDRFGRKNYFLASILGFTLASVACGAADNLTFLIVARVVQGAFGGGLLATAQAILRDTFPPKQLGISQAIFALGVVMGPTLGPPLGGILVDNASWNWCFDINIVPGIVSAVMLFILLRDPSEPRAGPVDSFGLALLAVTLGSLQYVLTEGERHYWLADGAIRALTLAFVVCGAAFIYWELYGTKAPIVDLRVFKNRSVAAGSLLALALGMTLFGTTYILPQLTQGPLGFTPSLSGNLFILRALPIALFSLVVARLSAKVDPRWFLGIGFVLIAVGSAMQAFVTTGISTFWTFAISLVIVGTGTSLLFVPLSIAVLGATTPAQGPKAGAMVNLAIQLGGSLAVALLDVVIDRRMSFHSEVLGAAANQTNPAVQQFLQQGGSTAALAGIVDSQAAILAFADATFVIALVAAVCTPLVFLMRKPRVGGGAPAAASH
ncbi:MAG TPA: DHA2 family efflux MFS transporter permease subunit [Candidatus Baltobacteraceae bacterium]|nr:DHA2 family efflux MFS transporter permease subunit [Candidatus Baltobacteraceae bacterium]